MSSNHKPAVSVVLSVYNGQSTIDACLASIKQQTFSHWEIVAINDGSTDQTAQHLQTWQKKLGSLKMHVITNQQNMGLTKSLNKGLSHARGTYIARIDADDTWHPHKLAKQVNFLTKHHDIGIIGSWYETQHQNHTRTTRLPSHDRELRQGIYRQNPFGHSCVLIRSNLLAKVNGYDETIRYGQDRDLWFRLLPHTKFHNIPDILCYRRGDHNLSTTHTRQQMWQGVKTRIKYIRQNHAPWVNYLYVAEPLAVMLTPRLAKQVTHTISTKLTKQKSYKLPTTSYQLLFINDRPLNPTRAETVARNEMAHALRDNDAINNVRVVTTKPLLTPFIAMPPPRSLIYMRCGAIAASLIALRNLLSVRLLILEVHNFSFGEYQLADLLYKSAARRCNLLITISEQTKQNWISANIKANKILVLPSGVNLQAHTSVSQTPKQLRTQLNLPQNKTICIYCGNLYKDRGIEDILKAANLLKQHTQLHFVFVGGTTKDLSYYQQYAKKHFPGLTNVQWAGYQPHHQIPKFLKASDISLVTYSANCPTLNTMSPLKLFEAMASQTPIITPDLPRIRQVVSINSAALYQPNNAASLAAAIKELIANPQDANARAAQAFTDARSYTWQRRVNTILSHLKSSST